MAFYVDDFLYWSESDKAEAKFEKIMSDKLKLEFMGPVLWFLGCKYEWGESESGELTLSISQGAYTRLLLEPHSH